MASSTVMRRLSSLLFALCISTIAGFSYSQEEVGPFWSVQKSDIVPYLEVPKTSSTCIYANQYRDFTVRFEINEQCFVGGILAGQGGQYVIVSGSTPVKVRYLFPTASDNRLNCKVGEPIYLSLSADAWGINAFLTSSGGWDYIRNVDGVLRVPTFRTLPARDVFIDIYNGIAPAGFYYLLIGCGNLWTTNGQDLRHGVIGITVK